MRFLALIKDKTITYGNLQYARFHLSKLEGKKVIVTIEKVHNKRSLNQNAYYWVCLGIIAEHTGHSSDELHRIFKGLYLPKKQVILNNKKYMLAGSTTDLTKGQFVEYMLHISAEAGQMGVSLPSPDEYKRGLDGAMLLTD